MAVTRLILWTRQARITKLRAGDLTGNNIVNLQDYALLGTRFYTFDLSTDITGDGQVDYDDYYLLALIGSRQEILNRNCRCGKDSIWVLALV